VRRAGGKRSIRKIAAEFGVPFQTLKDRTGGRVDPESFGRETVFNKEEEVELVEFAESMARFVLKAFFCKPNVKLLVRHAISN